MTKNGEMGFELRPKVCWPSSQMVQRPKKMRIIRKDVPMKSKITPKREKVMGLKV